MMFAPDAVSTPTFQTIPHSNRLSPLKYGWHLPDARRVVCYKPVRGMSRLFLPAGKDECYPNNVYIDQKIRFDLIRSAIGEGRGRLLEVGCGDGAMSRFLSGEGHTVFSCDLPSSHGGRPTAPRVFWASGACLPVATGSMDYAISCDVLEHVPPALRPAFLQELLRVTKPGGSVVCTVFIRKTLSFRIWGAAWLLASGNLPIWYAEHVTIPTPLKPDILAALTSSGGELLISREYQGPLNMLFMWLQNASKWMGMTKLSSWIDKGDILGRRVSYLIAVRKPRVA
jgi:SAM-dependent methyltransferase